MYQEHLLFFSQFFEIEKGKAIERWRRKAAGLQLEGAMTAGLPKVSSLWQLLCL